MPLHVLGALVVGGITLVVLLVHLFGGSRGARFETEAAARDALLADYPEADPGAAEMLDDGRGAVFAAGRGAGLALAFGAGRLTRLFAPGDLTRVEDRVDGLRLHTADFGAPNLFLPCADQDRRARIHALLTETTR